MRTLAHQVGLEFVDLARPCRSTPRSRRSSASRSPAATRRSRSRWEDGRLVVAMADPSNVFAVDDIRAIDRRRGQDRRRDRVSQIIETIEQLLPHGRRRRRGRAGRRGRATTTTLDLSSLNEVVEDAPIVKFVNLLITQAVAGPRVRHPRRADRARPAHPVPHRRRAARGDALAAQHPGRRHQPPEGHGRHQHRRAPHPAGRPHLDEGAGPRHRPARRDAADGVRREGRHAHPRQGPGAAAPRGPRASCPRRSHASRTRTASRTARSS